jgi:hypothetical protein
VRSAEGEGLENQEIQRPLEHFTLKGGLSFGHADQSILLDDRMVETVVNMQTLRRCESLDY